MDMGCVGGRLSQVEQQAKSSKTLLVTRILYVTEAGERSPVRLLMLALMSAFGPKRTCVNALRMSAFGGKADMGWCSANVCF